MSKTGMPWFRFYEDWLSNPKVQVLDPILRDRYVSLLCLRCRGEIPGATVEEIAWHLRLTVQEVEATLAKLAAAEMWTGSDIHNWDARQRQSDNSNVRKQSQRQRTKSRDTSRDMSQPVPSHVPSQSRVEKRRVDTEGEERREEEDSDARARESGGNGVVTGKLDVFAVELHRSAYLASRIEHGNGRDFDAVLQQVHAPITGGPSYDWPVIGAALLELRGAGARFTASTLRAFCRRLLQPEPVGAKASTAVHGARQAKNLAAIAEWYEATGGDNGE